MTDFEKYFSGILEINLPEQKEWMNSLPCVKMELDGTDAPEANIKKIIEKWREGVLVNNAF